MLTIENIIEMPMLAKIAYYAFYPFIEVFSNKLMYFSDVLLKCKVIKTENDQEEMQGFNKM